MKKSLRRHKISFQNALTGLLWAIKTQPNFRVHFTVSAAALLLGWVLRISNIEFLILVFTIVLGIGAEMINTSIEAMTDLITTEYRLEAKIAKDVSAGMMLFTALGSVIVACIIFIPYLIHV